MKLLDQGYSLYILHQENISDDEDEPKIGKISGNILKAHIKYDGEAWYAYWNAFDYLPDEIGEDEEEYFEGARNLVAVNSYERNKDAREKCISIHGYKCEACDFDFEKIW